LRRYVLRSTLPIVKNSSRKLTGRPNDPPILILTSLAGGPKHGHALSKDIEGFAGVVLGPGALYGAISRLEERGLIEPLESDDRRRPYRISSAGSAYLSAVIDEMRRLADEGTRRLAVAQKAPVPRRAPRIAGSPA
jgi:DNA-binding PadR family transcriptional regulator